MLASNINSLTHYAKGTLFLLISNFIQAAYKTTISNLSFTVLYAVAYILYLALEEGSPIFKQNNIPFYLYGLISTFIHTNYRISFDFFS